MASLIIEIDVPPVGELELSGYGSSQMAEEMAARERIVDGLRPYLSSFPQRPPRRAGKVSHVQLLGENAWCVVGRWGCGGGCAG